MGSSPQVPEILPPDPAASQPQEPVRRPRPSWVVAPSTYLLMGVNIVVYLVMVAHHVSPTSPGSDQLIFWGANHAGLVLQQGQWWRVVSAMFVHVGFFHLATNMWCLWNLGLLAEPLLGSWGLVAAYILTGAAGNLLSIGWNWGKWHDVGVFPAGAGASGAVFGIAGALIVLLKSPRLPVPPEELRGLRRSVVSFAAINLLIGFSINFGANVIGAGLNIDNSAHLGGCVCGLLFALPLVPRIGSPRAVFVRRMRVALVGTVVLLSLFSFYLNSLAG